MIIIKNIKSIKMNLEQLEKANKLAKQIEDLKQNIQDAKYTQCEDVAIRETYLRVNGVDDILVPASLFRTVGKLILAENSMELIKLEIQLSEI